MRSHYRPREKSLYIEKTKFKIDIVSLSINAEKNLMVYIHLDLSRKRQIQKRFIEYTQSNLSDDLKIEELIDWENKEEILAWLDSL